jgi:hypothetical protein
MAQGVNILFNLGNELYEKEVSCMSKMMRWAAIIIVIIVIIAAAYYLWPK